MSGAESERPTKILDRLRNLQCRCEDVAGIASITAETNDDISLNGVLAIIQREMEGLREGLNEVIVIIDKGGAA